MMFFGQRSLKLIFCIEYSTYLAKEIIAALQEKKLIPSVKHGGGSAIFSAAAGPDQDSILAHLRAVLSKM